MSYVVEVDLVIQSGEKVTTVELPPFKKMPNVIVWGQRYFTLMPDRPNTYEEAFTWFCSPNLVNDPIVEISEKLQEGGAV